MKLVCPDCGLQGSAGAFTADASARQFMARLAQLPGPLAEPALRYLALFRPARRALAWSRAVKLLEELAEHIHYGPRRRGRAWHATTEIWEAAFEVVLNARDNGKLRLPMKSHGYLLEVVVTLTDQVEGRMERDREEQLRHGGADRVRQADTQAEQPEPRRADPAVARRYVREAMEKLTGKGARHGS